MDWPTHPTFSTSFERDDGSEILIEYALSPYDPGVSYGPAERCYPPEGGELQDWRATDDAGKAVRLSEAEAERVEDQINAMPQSAHEPEGEYL